jgi:hypothetical protein
MARVAILRQERLNGLLEPVRAKCIGNGSQGEEQKEDDAVGKDRAVPHRRKNIIFT